MSMIVRILRLVAALWAGQAILATASEAAPSIARTLQDHHWTLQSATDSAGRPVDALLPPGHPFVMSFDGARLSIRGGCNQLVGGWRLTAPATMTIGRLAGTMKACDAPLMQADAALSAALMEPVSIELVPGPTPGLRLSAATRQVLTFSGQPTLRSLYGAPTRIFLEVAAQTVDCALPPGSATTCLQVRDVRFDDKGLRKGPPGPWRPFAGGIEGFTHTPGVRSVLRIDRYRRKPAPADAPADLYVLDLVVESETVAGK
jgi:heat shock protein HslJ